MPQRHAIPNATSYEYEKNRVVFLLHPISSDGLGSAVCCVLSFMQSLGNLPWFIDHRAASLHQGFQREVSGFLWTSHSHLW